MAKLSDAEIAALVGRFSGEPGASAKHQEEGRDFIQPYADGIVSRAYPAPSFEELPAYKRLEVQLKVGKATGVTQPFFMVHEGCAHATTVVDGRTLLNFSTYDYLGLNGDPRVNAAAVAAMERYGTSASASRLVAGERPVHRELEKALAAHYGTEDALVFVSGYATNVTVIATLFDRGDIIFEDALVHNSIVTGAVSSGATRVAVPHNDVTALERLLKERRHRHRRAIIVTEGVFSMDGNCARLKELIALKKRYGCFLMVDEAHALGVTGKTGRGSFEREGIDPAEVDIWMGTLSKTLCTCGGYIAGAKALVMLLRYTAPAFVYSVGLSPALAAASLKALELLHAETWRVHKLQENARYALDTARALGLNTGLAEGTSILPILVGSSLKAAFLSNLLMERGVCALPVIHPVVPEGEARLRLFLSAAHDREHLKSALKTIAACLPEAEAKAAAFSTARVMEAEHGR